MEKVSFMATGVRYPGEMKERALRLVDEAMAADPELGRLEAFRRIAERLGIRATTLQTWYYTSGRGNGKVEKVPPTPEAKRIKELEREVKELKRANEILKAASAFFARVLITEKLSHRAGRD